MKTESVHRLQENMRQQAVINEILQALHTKDTGAAFQVILDTAGSYLDISRILLFEDEPEHLAATAVHEWCNDGVAPLMTQEPYVLHYEQDIPELAADLAKNGHSVVNYGAIPAGSQRHFGRAGVVATSLYAVEQRAGRYGFICFDENTKPRTWAAHTLEFLQNIAALVSAAVMRHQDAQEAASTQKVMAAIVDNIPTYIFVTDPETDVIAFANEAFKQEFGYMDYYHPGVNPLYDCIVSRCRDCPNRKLGVEHCNPFYHEINCEAAGMWLGVQCSVIPWIDGKKMRLYASQNITEKKQKEEYIRRMAYTDHLTGLPNRYRCDVELDEAVKRAQKTQEEGYVLFLDLDDFKIVNDGYGHDYGDALLVSFSNFLRGSMAQGNRVFRFGGDEFVVLVPPPNAPEVEQLIEDILQRARRPWAAAGKQFYCTVSIGAVRFPGGNMGVKEILKNADTAMYAAKRAGKNGYAYYNSTMSNLTVARAELEGKMRRTIANGFEGFGVYFQPVVNIQEDEIAGAEALLRWTLPDGQPALPGDFIPLAEYLGLIVPLGEFVLRRSCEMLKKINDSGRPRFHISVNVSIRQLQQQDIVQRVEEILAETGADPCNLTLEVTEGMALGDFRRILLICNTLRQKGIEIAMDDFGTGYSSLSNMRSLPIDIIKIDRAFIRDISVDPYANSFIRLIAELGHSMGRRICVEGVETREQLAYCKQAGVDLVQGFHFYKPMPPGDFAETVLCEALGKVK